MGRETSAASAQLLLLAQQLIEHGAAVAVLGARDALARRSFALALAAAALVVRIEAAALVAAGLLEAERGLVAARFVDLEVGDLEFFHGARGAQRLEFAA